MLLSFSYNLLPISVRPLEYFFHSLIDTSKNHPLEEQAYSDFQGLSHINLSLNIVFLQRNPKFANHELPMLEKLSNGSRF